VVPVGEESEQILGGFREKEVKDVGSGLSAFGALAARLAARAAVVRAPGCRLASTIDFGGVSEVVLNERVTFPRPSFKRRLERTLSRCSADGTQGRGQAMNARDNGLNVIVGLREGGGSGRLRSRMAGSQERTSSTLMRPRSVAPSSCIC